MKTIHVDPLTRVEGHGRVELSLDAKGRLAGTRVALFEAPRLFEEIVRSRHLSEVPALVSRICAICAAAHRINAARALEVALAVEVPPVARRVRELLLLGGHIESHALHLFCLIYPDLAGVPSLVQLLRDRDPRAQAGLDLKALGNRIQETAGGRVIHPINIEVGGVLRCPPRQKLALLQVEMDGWEARLPWLLEPFSQPDRFPAGQTAAGIRIAVSGSGESPLLGDRVAFSDGREVSAANCRGALAEKAVAYSHAKQSGGAGELFLTGALARLEIARDRGRPMGRFDGREGNIHLNSAAQGEELYWALARSRQLIAEILDEAQGQPVRSAFVPAAGVGTAVLEAPRGLLLHHYVLDDLGRVAQADIITPTAVNQAAMEAQLKRDLDSLRDEGELIACAERIIRAYDPCISCAVHVLRGEIRSK